MTAPSSPAVASAAPAPSRARRPSPLVLLLAACVALAALSLLGPSFPTYDPWAWIIWGREVTHWDLQTTTGPSWKPLPVAFTTVFALFGDDAAPQLWLVVARTAGLFALAMTFRLARRLGGGTVGGLVAVAGLVLADRFVSLTQRGNSEGALVALVLLAIERHLEGRRRQAFVLAVLSGLLRPEMWALIALYGLWWLWSLWRARGAAPVREAVLVVGAGVAMPLLWFVPEYLGSGDLLRAANRALEPVADSPAQADHPFLATFTNASHSLIVPVYAGAVVAVALAAWRRRARGDRRADVTLAIAAAATLLMVTVAVEAEIGFTGNARYVLLPAAAVCVLSGVGWVALARQLRARVPLAAGLAVLAVLAAGSVPFVLRAADGFGDEQHTVRFQARLGDDLAGVIRGLGGRERLLACGTVFTSPIETQMLAWELQVPERDVPIDPDGTGTILAPAGQGVLDDGRYGPRGRTGDWAFRTTCPGIGEGPAAR